MALNAYGQATELLLLYLASSVETEDLKLNNIFTRDLILFKESASFSPEDTTEQYQNHLMIMCYHLSIL